MTFVSDPPLPMSDKYGRKRPYTEKYDGLHVIVYLRVLYGDIRRYTKKKRSFTVLVHGGRIQSPFSSVYDCIAPYTVTEIYDRNTITCITAKYGRIRSYHERLRSFTTVYGALNSRPGYFLHLLWNVSVSNV